MFNIVIMISYGTGVPDLTFNRNEKLPKNYINILKLDMFDMCH